MVGKADPKPCEPPQDSCSVFLNRPLGGFAMMGAWAGIVELVCCCFAFQSKDLLTACHPPDGFLTEVGIWNWLLISAVGALMHVFFAPYVYFQLWRKLIAETKEVDDPKKGPTKRTLEARTKDGAIRASKHDILEAFKDTFRGDPIIYFYALVLVVDCAWSILGLVWIYGGGHDCNPRGWTLRSAYASIVFCAFVMGYSIAWYFYMQSMDGNDTLTLRSAEPGYLPPKQAAAATQHPTIEDHEHTQSGSCMCCGGNQASSSSNQASSSMAQTPSQPLNAPKRKPSIVLATPKLAACLILDALGNATYFVPGVGELGDIVFAPASAVMMRMLFDRNGISALNGLEEILPGTDACPTATLAWTMETLMPDSIFTRMFGLQKC